MLVYKSKEMLIEIKRLLFKSCFARAVDRKITVLAEFGRIARRNSLLEMDNIGRPAKMDRYEEARKQVPSSESFQRTR